MTIKQNIRRVLDSVIHPETGRGLSQGGYVAEVSAEEVPGNDAVILGPVAVVLRFSRVHEPFAVSLRRQAEGALKAAFPGALEILVRVDVPRGTDSVASKGASRRASGSAGPKTEPEQKSTARQAKSLSAGKSSDESASKRLPGVRRVIAVASGKGGVGKSTVAAHLAVTLAAQGYRVGILDADVYGPSQPALFGVESYLPIADGEGAGVLIAPALGAGVKIMSIGFFISASDALVWRGPMATGALRQLIHQTAWGELDFLLVDLPPGTGDIHLSLAGELALDGAVIVSTPQSLALADVRRGVEMFRTEGMDVPILGIVENMAWFTPAELPDNKYHIFGEGGARKFAKAEKIEFLGDIPIVQSIMESGEKGLLSQGIAPEVAPYYEAIARRIVDKLSEEC